MKVHAFDTIIYRLDEHLVEFVAAELVSELAGLGRRPVELRHTQRCIGSELEKVQNSQLIIFETIHVEDVQIHAS